MYPESFTPHVLPTLGSKDVQSLWDKYFVWDVTSEEDIASLNDFRDFVLEEGLS